MAYEGLMVSVSGVRGRVGEGLTPEIVARFAAGFGAWAQSRSGLDSPTVVVGRDSGQRRRRSDSRSDSSSDTETTEG